MELKLYEMPAIMQDLINDVDEDWCLTETALAKLDKLNLALEDKAKWIWAILRTFKSYEDTIASEIKRLTALKKSYKTNADSLKSYLGYNLKQLEMEKLETDLFKFSFRKSKSVVIEDGVLPPDEYLKTTISIDKSAILKDLKAGKEIKGCALLEKDNLQIK